MSISNHHHHHESTCKTRMDINNHWTEYISGLDIHLLFMMTLYINLPLGLCMIIAAFYQHELQKLATSGNVLW